MKNSATTLKRWKQRIHVFLHPRHKIAFIVTIAKNGRLLDVGCGNDSPQTTKRIRPDLSYTGLDVDNYEQSGSATEYADCYLIVPPENFAAEIEKRPDSFDAVISNHNLEHCLEPERVLVSMLRSVRKNGLVYFAFPCAESIHFPRRTGTLNFYDDATHVYVPDYEKVVRLFREYNFEILFARRRYRPWRRFLIGIACEPMSALQKKVMRGTWELYGFESVLWARKK